MRRSFGAHARWAVLATLLVAGFPEAGTPCDEHTSSIAGLQGEVVVINRDYQFAVIDVGRTHGVTTGTVFEVSRGYVLGRIQVQRVYDELSAAVPLPGTRIEDLQEHDRVDAVAGPATRWQR